MMEIPRDCISRLMHSKFSWIPSRVAGLTVVLIRKHNLEILDIPMAELTQQYMAYVEMMRVDQLELAAEYLLMTALLIEIKSRMLLPNPKSETEPEQIHALNCTALLEYEQMKKAALRLNELPQLSVT